MSLKPPASVRELQQTLHAKAKGNPSYRFYSLYDKIYRKDVLRHAWERCRENGGAVGVDGQSFEEIEAQGVEGWLEELTQELKDKTYQAEALRRVWIAKSEGKQRPIGIATIRDRVIQTATMLVLGPIFEADLPEEQYGYRGDRSAHDAVREVHRRVNLGQREVVDADLQGYYDTIPHREMMKSLARRISDGAMLKLLKMWLEMAVEETDERGEKKRTRESKRTGRGTPQGSPVSPLLSNIYMRRFVLGWKQQGMEQRYGAIVNYADDLVILCRQNAQEALERMQTLMGKLKLRVNEAKTRVCRVPEESFDFLGYTIGRCHRPGDGSAYIGTRPARKRVQRICKKISGMTRRNTYDLGAREMIEQLNSVTRGWANYFCLGSVSKAYRAVDGHVRYRLRQWLSGKHQQGGHGHKKYPDEVLDGEMGLLRLERITVNFPWAKA